MSAPDGAPDQLPKSLLRMGRLHMTRKPPMLVRVALANKMARIVWALMARGGVYQSPVAAA